MIWLTGGSFVLGQKLKTAEACSTNDLQTAHCYHTLSSLRFWLEVFRYKSCNLPVIIYHYHGKWIWFSITLGT